jgi:O-antigen/teichoic acid export membrane protein
MEGESARTQDGRVEDRGRHIVRGIGSLTVQSILNAFLGFILLASLIRFLSQSDYGTYSSVQVSIGIGSVVSVFGLSAAVVRFLAPESHLESSSSWGAAKAALYMTVVLSAAVSLLVVATAPYLSSYFGKSASLTWAFYLGAAWLFISSVAATFQAMLQGMRRYASLARVLLGSRFIAVAIAVVGVALYHSLAIAIASQIIYFGLMVLAVLPAVWNPLRQANPRPHYFLVTKYAYVLGLAVIVSTIAGNADIVVVGGYLSLGSLGIYNAAIQISSVLSAFFVVPLVTALFAEASLSSESEEELRAGTSLAIRFTMVTLLPASLFATAMAHQLFDLFSGGGPYSQGIPYLQLITLFYAFATVQTIAVIIMQGVSRTRQVLVVGVVTAVGEVILSVLLVPGLGLAGATYSRITMFVIGCCLSLYFIRRHLPRSVDYRFFAKSLLASAVPAVAVYALSNLISNRLITIVPFTLLGMALFVVCTKAFKLLTVEDKSYLGHLLPDGLQWVVRLI